MARLLVTLYVAVGLMAVVDRVYIPVARRASETNLFRYWVTFAFPIAAMLIPLAFKYVTYRYLTLRGTPLYITDFAAICAALLAAIVALRHSFWKHDHAQGPLDVNLLTADSRK